MNIHRAFEDEGMSEEEDYLDYLLGDENEEIQDPDVYM